MIYLDNFLYNTVIKKSDYIQIHSNFEVDNNFWFKNDNILFKIKNIKNIEAIQSDKKIFNIKNCSIKKDHLPFLIYDIGIIHTTSIIEKEILSIIKENNIKYLYNYIPIDIVHFNKYNIKYVYNEFLYLNIFKNVNIENFIFTNEVKENSLFYLDQYQLRFLKMNMNLSELNDILKRKKSILYKGVI